MSAAKSKLPASLPDDPEQFKALVVQLSEHVRALEECIRLERLRKFAARSEKTASGQFELFNEAELCEVVEPELAEQEQVEEPQNSSTSDTKRAGRKALPADPPRIRIEHDLPESQRGCACGCERSVIGEETSEQLDIIPAKIRVLVHVRKKYACRRCEAGVETAPLPPQPIPKSNASAGLLAHVAVAPVCQPPAAPLDSELTSNSGWLSKALYAQTGKPFARRRGRSRSQTRETHAPGLHACIKWVSFALVLTVCSFD